MKLISLLIVLGAARLALAAAPWEARDLNPVTMHAPPSGAAISLVESGAAKAVLFVPGKGGPFVDGAVAQLQSCIKQASGVELPVVDKLDDRSAVVIGDCPEATAIGVIGAKLPVEGLAIKTTPNRVFIVGNSYGLAWGVYEFAERFVGARWYFPGDAGRFAPKSAAVAIPPVWLEDKPAFPMRVIWPPVGEPWHGKGTDLQPVQTALRCANAWPHQLQVHTPNWSGVEEYKRDRPEVFQLTESGQRDWTMLCYGNSKTLETYLENIDKAVRGQPSNINIVNDTITVCPNDAEVTCHCKDCRALWNPKGGGDGTASRIVATFTARLAAEVQKRWPKLTVLQLAYFNYTDPPLGGVAFPPNVEIQLCGMPGMAMFKEPALRLHEQENVDRWMAFTGGRKVQNWHYTCWPEDRTKAVFAYPHVVRDYYRDNVGKTVGTFINGEGDHWPRQHLSLYCWMKCLWNPAFDVDAAVEAYCRNMFGDAAASDVRELVQLQIDGWEKSRWPGAKLSAKNVYEISYPPAMIARMKQLVSSIRTKTKSDPVLAARAAYLTGPFDAMFTEAAQTLNGKRTPLVVQRVGESPTVDGKLDDPAWQRSAAPANFIRAYDRDHPQPTYPTSVQSVWTDAGVTFAFRMTEPAPDKLEKSKTGRDHSTLWWDDNVELLLDVTGKNQGEYYHFIISAGNVIADAKGKDYSWSCDGIKSAVAIDKGQWTLEVSLPFAAFPEAVKPTPGKSGAAWTGNFTRHRMAGSDQEYQRMNTTFAIPSENLSDFAPIEFRE